MMNIPSDISEAVYLPDWYTPTGRDVICGWARQNHKHAGNRRFRKLVEHSAPLYVAASTKLEKTQVTAAVVDKVRRDSPGGGFLKKDMNSGLWFEIGDDKARDKVGHAIRRSIDERKRKKNKAKLAKTKMIPGQSRWDGAEDDQTTENLPHVSLDDFSPEEDDEEVLSTTKIPPPKMFLGADRGDEDSKLSASNMSDRNLPQNQYDGVVVPSFLFPPQGAPLMSSFVQHQGASHLNEQVPTLSSDRTTHSLLPPLHQPPIQRGLSALPPLPGRFDHTVSQQNFNQLVQQGRQRCDASGNSLHGGIIGQDYRTTSSASQHPTNLPHRGMPDASSAMTLEQQLTHLSSTNHGADNIELFRATHAANSLQDLLHRSVLQNTVNNNTIIPFGLAAAAFPSSAQAMAFGMHDVTRDPLLGSRGDMSNTLGGFELLQPRPLPEPTQPHSSVSVDHHTTSSPS